MRSYRLAVEELISDGEVNCGRLYVLRLFIDAMVRGYPLYGDVIRREHESLKTSHSMRKLMVDPNVEHGQIHVHA